jgi:HK97 family phage portal protein
MELDKRTIAGLLGVPPYLVGIGEYDKEAFNGFIATRLRGVAQVIEQELTRKLLYADNLYWRFNTRSMYAYNLGEIIEAGAEMTDRMAMRRNEWRDWVGMSPDPEMTELLALENYIPADQLGNQKKLIGGGENDV